DFHVTGVQTCALPISEYTVSSLADRAADFQQIQPRPVSLHKRFFRDNPAQCRCWEKPKTLSFRKILRPVVTEIKFPNIAPLIAVGKSSSQPLVTVRERIASIVIFLVV